MSYLIAERELNDNYRKDMANHYRLDYLNLTVEIDLHFKEIFADLYNSDLSMQPDVPSFRISDLQGD
ncbi:UNVERIFIED_CONTAM: hypothetical protein KB573_06065 [Streptococcus canis]|uniref:Uncharacterized protein n=1 Tax=Streptococcus canis FSL Z3-227 TaxID=482234 RepID=A0AAV3FQB1_STRCB|nr:hypothetical protein [Streptococcus canis]EIQ81346.1 hypothetical protein SCAZ3_02940 [Streptococcus canis FSL Z3-227]MDV5987813.1 hypothetical protein [Streptococcus canis]MDV5993513.1 hypothetical protein [Streptococcus canis]MDV6001544.1 hypothetical protein [Streptococcus canis]MDV6022737.1 hypothetical protein [Streptococcus canis]